MAELSRDRWAYVIMLVVAAAVLLGVTQCSNPPQSLEFNDITGDSLQDLVVSLLLIAVFKERAQQVYVTAWRAEGRARREADVKGAGDDSEKRLKAEEALAIYRAETGRYVSVLSLGSGVLISLAGVRVLAPLVQPPAGGAQAEWLFAVDVLLTAGILAGGSKLIHEVIAPVSKALERTRDRMS